MWRLQQSLRGTCVYSEKKILYAGLIKATVKRLFSNDGLVSDIGTMNRPRLPSLTFCVDSLFRAVGHIWIRGLVDSGDFPFWFSEVLSIHPNVKGNVGF